MTPDKIEEKVFEYRGNNLTNDFINRLQTSLNVYGYGDIKDDILLKEIANINSNWDTADEKIMDECFEYELAYYEDTNWFCEYHADRIQEVIDNYEEIETLVG